MVYVQQSRHISLQQQLTCPANLLGFSLGAKPLQSTAGPNGPYTHELVDQISPSATTCSAEEYMNRELDVPTCIQYDDDWEVISSLNLVIHEKTQKDKKTQRKRRKCLMKNHHPQISQNFKMLFFTQTFLD